MSKIDLEKTKLSPGIWRWVWDTLEEISDEVGTERNGKYLLVYEGWNGLCISKAYDPTKSDGENEDAYYKFAEEQANRVIEEWVEKYKDHYSLIDCGHEPTGLYGITWALFKEYNDKSIAKSGRRQAMGYPDIEFTDEFGRLNYLECKSFNIENMSTSQRAFYLSPSRNFKITRDAHHFVISFEVYVESRKGQKNIYKCKSWKILSVENLEVDVKYEFNSDNARMYIDELILAEGKLSKGTKAQKDKGAK